MKGTKTVVLLGAVIVVAAIATIGVMLLLGNINERKEEAKQDVFRVVEIPEETLDPAVWGQNYPRQYDGYLRTVDIERTRYGGSEAFQKLDEDPVWRDIFAGYAFGIDYREERGHAYMLSDQEETRRVTEKPQPGACLHCHSNIIPAYQKMGLENGAPAGEENRAAQIQKGFELISGMPYSQAHTLVSGPIGCGDCHDPKTMQLRLSRPGLVNGLQELADSDARCPICPVSNAGGPRVAKANTTPTKWLIARKCAAWSAANVTWNITSRVKAKW
jgi:nitrite reductase (cytochrome c-552)